MQTIYAINWENSAILSVASNRNLKTAGATPNSLWVPSPIV